MSEYTACPIWGTLASIEPLTSDGVTVDSPRAGGRYLITGRATGTLKSHDENLKVRLTAWLIEQHRLGVDCPEILVLIYLTTSRSVPQLDRSKIMRGKRAIVSLLENRTWTGAVSSGWLSASVIVSNG